MKSEELEVDEDDEAIGILEREMDLDEILVLFKEFRVVTRHCI